MSLIVQMMILATKHIGIINFKEIILLSYMQVYVKLTYDMGSVDENIQL